MRSPLLFLIGCIGARTLFALLAKNFPNYLPFMGLIALLIAVGFIYRYLSGTRKTGPETFGEKIWWNDLRPLHAALYLTFALLAFRKSPYAWILLAIDVVIGLTAFLYYHHFVKRDL